MAEAENFQEEYNCLKNLQPSEIYALENVDLLRQFVMYFIDRQFGAEKMPLTSSPKHRALMVHEIDEGDIRPLVLSIKPSPKSSAQLKQMLNRMAKYLLTRPVSVMFLNAFHFDLRIMKHAISRQKAFAFLLLWIETTFKGRYESCNLHSSTSEEFMEAKALILLGVCDIWSAIRKSVSRKLATVVTHMSYDCWEALFQDLVTLCVAEDQTMSWQSLNGVLLALSVMLSTIKVETKGYRVGIQRIETLPTVVLLELKPAIFLNCSNEQLSVRENAAVALKNYVDLVDVHSITCMFQQVVAQLYDVKRTHDLAPPRAEGLLELCCILAEKVPREFLAKHFSIVLDMMRASMQHSASTVRIRASELLGVFIARSIEQVDDQRLLQQILRELLTFDPEAVSWQYTEGFLLGMDTMLHHLASILMQKENPQFCLPLPRVHDATHDALHITSKLPEHKSIHLLAPKATIIVEDPLRDENIQLHVETLEVLKASLDSWLHIVQSVYCTDVFEVGRMASQLLPKLVMITVWVDSSMILHSIGQCNSAKHDPKSSLVLCTMTLTLVRHLRFLQESKIFLPDYIAKAIQRCQPVLTGLIDDISTILRTAGSARLVTVAIEALMMLCIHLNTIQGTRDIVKKLRHVSISAHPDLVPKTELQDYYYSVQYNNPLKLDLALSAVCIRLLPAFSLVLSQCEHSTQLLPVLLLWLDATEEHRWITTSHSEAHIFMLDSAMVIIQHHIASAVSITDCLLGLFSKPHMHRSHKVRAYNMLLYLSRLNKETRDKLLNHVIEKISTIETTKSPLHIDVDCPMDLSEWDDWDEDEDEIDSNMSNETEVLDLCTLIQELERFSDLPTDLTTFRNGHMGQKASKQLDGVIPQVPTSKVKESTVPVTPNETLMPETVRKSDKLAQFAPICSEIDPPYLYVSGANVAQNEALLHTIGISHIINCSKEVAPDMFPESIHYFSLALRDGATENIGAFFYEMFDLIHQVREKKQKVLIHCQQGVSRSCTVAIAYLMWAQQLSYSQAFQLVKQRRGVCSPNSGFICQLLELETTLKQPPKQLRLFRIAPHSQHESRMALKPCWTPDSRTFMPPDPQCFHSKACLVLQTSLNLYIWQGSNCILSESTIDALVNRLVRYEKLTQLDLVKISQHQEPEEFKKVFSTEFIVKDDGNYMYAYEWEYLQAHDDDLTVEKEPTREESSVCLYAVDLRSAELDDIGNYDSDDLVPDMIYLLKVSSTTFYIWKGGDIEADDGEILNHLMKLVTDLSLEKTTIEREGEESEEFWKAFESGY